MIILKDPVFIWQKNNNNSVKLFKNFPSGLQQ